MRGGLAVVTSPNELLLTFPSGSPNCAWLNALKSSTRNSAFILSVTAVSLSSAMSQLLRPGPEKKRRRDVPSLPRASGENSDVLKYDCPERGSAMRSEPGVKFG